MEVKFTYFKGMTNFIQKTHLDIGFSAFNCLLDSQCSLLTSQLLGSCSKLKWSNRAYAVYWLCGTLLYPWLSHVDPAPILSESNANPVPIYPNLMPIQCQSCQFDVDRSPTRCQSRANPAPICCQFDANQTPIHSNQMPI